MYVCMYVCIHLSILSIYLSIESPGLPFSLNYVTIYVSYFSTINSNTILSMKSQSFSNFDSPSKLQRLLLFFLLLPILANQPSLLHPRIALHRIIQLAYIQFDSLDPILYYQLRID